MTRRLAGRGRPFDAYYVDFDGSCCDKCNTLAEESKSAHVTSNTVVAPAWVTGATVMGTNPARLYQCFPSGVEVQIVPSFMGLAGPNESWRLRLKGAGLDFDQTVTQDQLNNGTILVTVPGTGDLDFWLVHEPHHVESNHVALKADATGRLGGGGSGADAGSSSGGTSSEETSGSQGGFGCNAVGGGAALAGVALLAPPALRRRRNRG